MIDCKLESPAPAPAIPLQFRTPDQARVATSSLAVRSAIPQRFARRAARGEPFSLWLEDRNGVAERTASDEVATLAWSGVRN